MNPAYEAVDPPHEPIAADGEKGDQKRVTTPARARELSSDYIVVGRPITAAPDPVAAYERCRSEFIG